MRKLTLIVAAIFVLGCGSAFAQTVVPVNGVTPALTSVTINAQPGDQYDPHVSGDWAAYTSDLSIRYYNFATNIDAQIPMGPSDRDLLSDISGSKIVFSRVISGSSTIVMVFDAATPAVAPVALDPIPGAIHIGSAIGGGTVAYINFELQGNGEVIVHDLITSASVRLTNDTAFDANPSVSPDGNVVTWEHCQVSTSNCDIWQAVKSGAVWNVSVAANTANPEANPDSNGSLIVYDSVLPTNDGEIFWRPVSGGAVTRLQLPGIEVNPSISGNLISFESRPILFSLSDIYVYDISTNLLYRITDTPLATEHLNDVTVLTDGRVRVVWTSDEDGFESRNVKSATFTLPPPVCQGMSSQGILGSLLPRPLEATITQGGAPNYADTYVTPYAATQTGTVTSWKAEFSGGLLINNAIGVPSGIQLKILRYSAPNILDVVAAGAVHDPRPILQARFPGYPYFQEIDSVIEFTDAGLSVMPGDIIGLTIRSDPSAGSYFYPLVSPSGTRLVLRDAAVGGMIDLADAFTGTLGWTPALQVNVNSCTQFNFLGFFQPVDNLPVLNVSTAGQAIPVKFSLSGDQGLNIFAAGYPASSQIACDANAPGDVIEETVTAGGSSLSYDAATDRYIYVWKTQKAWKGTCRILVVRLTDGSDHFAKFRFK